jgi:DNA-binding CsgD family transcriptional regulator
MRQREDRRISTPCSFNTTGRQSGLLVIRWSPLDMRHLILAFYLLALIAGTVSISQALLIWQRYRKLVIRRYAYFLLALLLILLSFIVDLYAQVASLSGNTGVRGLVWVFQAAGGILYIAVCPFFFHSLAGRAVPAWQKWFFFLLDALVVLAALGNLLFPTMKALPLALAGALFSMIVYGLVFTALHLGEIGERVLRRALWIFLCLTAAFFPLMLIDAAMSEAAFLSMFQFMNNMAQPAYFLILNCLSILFGLRYLNRPGYSQKGRLTDYFRTAFRITEREAQIIGLLMDGASMKEIGRKLFISPKTAENHVYNIYQKLGVRNRVQMFQVMSTNSLD